MNRLTVGLIDITITKAQRSYAHASTPDRLSADSHSFRQATSSPFPRRSSSTQCATSTSPAAEDTVRCREGPPESDCPRRSVPDTSGQPDSKESSPAPNTIRAMPLSINKVSRSSCRRSIDLAFTCHCCCCHGSSPSGMCLPFRVLAIRRPELLFTTDSTNFTASDRRFHLSRSVPSDLLPVQALLVRSRPAARASAHRPSRPPSEGS